MAKQFGVPRAAYIVHAMQPGSEVTFPPPRAAVPSRAAEAVLPDRWVVLAFKGGELRKFKAGNPIPEPLTLTPDPSDDAQTFVEVADGFTVPASVAWTVNYTEAVSKGMAIDLDLAGDELTSGFDRVIVLGVKTSIEPEDVTGFLSRAVRRAPLHPRHRPRAAGDGDQQRAGPFDAVHDARIRPATRAFRSSASVPATGIRTSPPTSIT